MAVQSISQHTNSGHPPEHGAGPARGVGELEIRASRRQAATGRVGGGPFRQTTVEGGRRKVIENDVWAL